ncbi:NUDIX domain-containing protein [Streptomyces smyrnaeus]|uniref:NUDIX domain-containing protein n=1 Tax=Streptomyces smyrnaeus TaxID=1387713 RepID=UPI00367FF3F8
MDPAPARPGISSGAVFTDELGRILLVHPVYKAGWNLPGGRVDEGETPHAACVREVREELGLTVDVCPEPMVTAWVKPADGPPHLYFSFEGGKLTAQQQAAIRLQDTELSDWRFFPLATEDPAIIPPRLQGLWEALRTACSTGRPTYREIAL